MAITVNTDELKSLREVTGMTDGNEVLFKTNAASTYVVEAIVTSAGSGTVKTTVGDGQGVTPSDFSGFAADVYGATSANYAAEVTGAAYVGFDVASGTWTVRVRKVS